MKTAMHTPRATQPSFASRAAPLTFAVGLLAGLAITGCPVERAPNPEHCFHASGDLTCAARFGAELPYCLGPGEGCPSVEYGCVAELPEPDCYSPCGDGTFASDDATCLELGDESTSEGSEGDLPPACGDGVVDDDEACDDGNDIDDDECNNACEPATCGDGVTQAAIGETCDDGNTQSGDTCAWNCTLPGTEIWSRTYADHACDDAAIALTTAGEVYIVADCDLSERRILHLDSDGEILWTEATPFDGYAAPNLAVSSDDGITIGGRGQVRHYDADANFVWSHNIPRSSAVVHAVTTDSADEVTAAGYGSGALFRYHYTPDGMVSWFQHDLQGTSVVAISSGPSDAIWSLQAEPARVEKLSAEGIVEWVTQTTSDTVADLAVGDDEHCYVVGYTYANGSKHYEIHKLDADGITTWLRSHDDVGVVEIARAVAVLPGGGALVAGSIQPDGVSDMDGMLGWFTPDGVNLLDAHYDGPMDGDMDRLVDVAVSADGFAFAVGYHDPGSGTKQLWLLKVAI